MTHVLRIEDYRRTPAGRRCLRGCGTALRGLWRGVTHPVTRRVAWWLITFVFEFAVLLVRTVLLIIGLVLGGIGFLARFI
jgi:hypothetical protein